VPPAPLFALPSLLSSRIVRRNKCQSAGGPACLTVSWVLYTTACYAFTLRGVGPLWCLARAAYALCAAVALSCLWLTHAADPGFLPPRHAPACGCLR
jgi:hypothetical protein